MPEKDIKPRTMLRAIITFIIIIIIIVAGGVGYN